MAACGSGGGLSSLFENPPLLPQNNTKQPQPWGLLDPMQPLANDSVLHSPSFGLSSESLQLCTEGLGFESSEDSSSVGEAEEDEEDQLKVVQRGSRMRRRSACRVFPPPIPSVGTGGRALVRFHSFKADGRFILKEVPAMVRFHSFKADGRFILKEVPIANQEHLHAHREDGRLTLRLVQQ